MAENGSENRIGRMIDCFREYLDNDDWKYEFDPERNMITCGVNLQCKLGSTRLHMLFKDMGCTIVAMCSLKADENCRDNVMRYITMANYGMSMGGFEMDLRDGEIRFRDYLCYKDMEEEENLSQSVIEYAITCACSMMQRYGDGLAALLMGFSTPEEEIKKAEEP